MSARPDGRHELPGSKDDQPGRDASLHRVAAVASVVRCQGRHGLDLALSYRQATHWWEPEQVANDLKLMLLAGDPPGRASLVPAKSPAELRGWFQQYGAEYLSRLAGN